MIFPSPNSNRGVTLIELMVVIAIVGILAGVALPNYSAFMAERSIAAETRRVIGALKLARSEARARGSVVTLARTAVGWNGEIQIYEDTAGPNNAFAPLADDLIRLEGSTGRTVQVVDDQGSSDLWISFNRQGWLAEPPVLIALCAPNLADADGMYIEINRVGKIRESPIGTSSGGCNP